jgi:hypothetical protein
MVRREGIEPIYRDHARGPLNQRTSDRDDLIRSIRSPLAGCARESLSLRRDSFPLARHLAERAMIYSIPRFA